MTFHPKKIFPALFLALVLGGAGCLFTNKLTPPDGAQCTMEAKLCPDGSAVGRSGPNCEFAPCPTPSPEPKPTPTNSPSQDGTCSGEGGSCPVGYRCVQDCGPPVVRENDQPPGWHCLTNEVASKPRMCPICLASNTQIDTPSGKIGVKDVRVGSTVWSIDARGRQMASKVIRVSQTPVPATHKVVHLTMTDGREVWASLNHPTADGRRVSDLQPGDIYDGVVAAAETVSYWDTATYDLLPDSETGEYRANGIWLGSTLSARQ